MNFAIIGVGGYIAPRHIEAIKDLGHNLCAAYDVNDSVGILDRYFSDCLFFTEQEKFKDYLLDQKKIGQPIEFVSICTPNYMHFSHAKLALEMGANVICEKPLVLNEDDLNHLLEIEKKTGKKVFTVLQLRVHEAILDLKKKIKQTPEKMYEIDLDYITTRGDWYHKSWKNNVSKSGGLSTNIGVHFFDMLTWIFGEASEVQILQASESLEIGFLQLKNAKVRWMLTIDKNQLPQEAIKKNKTTFRCLKIDGAEFEFSEGFTELHKKIYEDIFAGRGYGPEDSRMAIRIVERIRNQIANN